MTRTAAARALFFLTLAVGFAMRAHAALTDDGIYWPDEIYQSFEPAHWTVFGYGLKPWEFIQGARNWAFPGVVAALLKLCTWVGADSPEVYVRVIKLAFALLASGSGWGVYRLARSFGADELAASAGAAAWALCAPAVYFGFRATSENASAATAVLGLAFLLDPDASRRRLIVGASMLGLSVMFRLQLGLVAVAAVVVLLVRAGRGVSERRRAQLGRTALVTAVLAGWAVLFGATDALAWHDAPGATMGGWYHSAVVYLRFNLGGGAEAWGQASWSYYFSVLASSMPAVAAVTAVLAMASALRAPGLAVITALFLGLHSLAPHKEYRFILPMLPLLFAMAGIGLSVLPQRWRSAAPVVLVVVSLLSGLNRSTLTFADLGAYPALVPTVSAWDDYGPVNRLMMKAGQRPDLCGLRIDPMHAGAVGLAWTGGATYLHRPVPIYPPGYPHQTGHFNYLITVPGSGAEVVASEGGVELVRLPGVSCVPNPGYQWFLG